MADADHVTGTAAERRLARLRFDLHDGPQQDVVLLAEDLRLLRDELSAAMGEDPGRPRLLGLLDELQAKLVKLDRDLRRLAAFVRSEFEETESLTDALDEILRDFAVRSGIEPQVRVEGDFAGLSDSQQITVLNLIRETLSNVREHSGARSVTVELVSTEDGVQARIVDDGRGFDPGETITRAALAGHLGLVGMYERVSLLGGQTTIDSRLGGPTVVSFSLPAWRPADASGG